MKKIRFILLLCMMALTVSGCSKDEKKVQTTVDHSFYWGGTICSGVYTGEMQEGKPNGTGSFEGYVMRDGEERDEVSYTGKWKEGRIAGKGIFTNITKGISYEGKFVNNTKNGDFIVKEEETDTYEEVSFHKDIPYGVSFFRNAEDKKMVGYDRYYKGMRVSEIISAAQTFDYADLIFHMDEYSYEEICLDCQVMERQLKVIVISDEDASEEETETELIAELKVKDAEGNIYIAAYNAEYPKRAANFMPDVAGGDNIRIYGFIKSIVKKEADTSLLSPYPLIEAVTAEKRDSSIDIQKLPGEYQSFLDYPYEYQGSEVELSGTVKQIGADAEGNMFLVVVSDDYSSAGDVRYVCSYDIKNRSERKQGQMPKVGDSIRIQGKLDTVHLEQNAEDFTLYPKVVISDSLKKNSR